MKRFLVYLVLMDQNHKCYNYISVRNVLVNVGIKPKIVVSLVVMKQNLYFYHIDNKYIQYVFKIKI
jgi:hypothetical protein